MDALKDGKIVKGDVVVLRGLGVRGGSGMGLASRVVFALDGAGFGADVALASPTGSPQASLIRDWWSARSPRKPRPAALLALVADGDTIIDRRRGCTHHPPRRAGGRTCQTA